jgi:4'-phosphopantetheinyl transferase
MLDALRQGTCHLWHWRSGAAFGRLCEAGIGLLEAEELARYLRYLVRDAAATFLASRVLLRSVLSRYWDLQPSEWRFTANEWGRPEIANTGVPRGLRFNLSHKPGFVVCLAGYGRELGVDVEDASIRRPNLLDLADRFFSRAEAAGLRQTPPAYQLDRFYELWTLKESYIKARGQGLSLGLSRFSFSPAERSAKVQFEEGFIDRSDRWDFQLHRSEPPHLMATTIELLTGEGKADVELCDASPVVARTLRAFER